MKQNNKINSQPKKLILFVSMSMTPRKIKFSINTFRYCFHRNIFLFFQGKGGGRKSRGFALVIFHTCIQNLFYFLLQMYTW